MLEHVSSLAQGRCRSIEELHCIDCRLRQIRDRCDRSREAKAVFALVHPNRRCRKRLAESRNDVFRPVLARPGGDDGVLVRPYATDRIREPRVGLAHSRDGLRDLVIEIRRLRSVYAALSLGAENDAGDGIAPSDRFTANFPRATSETSSVIETRLLVDQGLVADVVRRQLRLYESVELRQQNLDIERLIAQVPRPGRVCIEPLASTRYRGGGENNWYVKGKSRVTTQALAQHTPTCFWQREIDYDRVRLCNPR